MGISDIALIGVGLAMDACAAAICKGLSMEKIDWKKAKIVALYFGLAQAIMPVIGYYLGTSFEGIIQKFDHIIAFMLLAIIGINMIIESFKKEKREENENVDFKSMIGLAIATSIDALATGVSFALIKTNIIEAALIIGIITYILSMLGVIIGNIFGDKLKNKAELLGGILLVLIGFKILLEHLI